MKYTAFAMLFVSFFIFTPHSVHAASLLTITKEGKVRTNVLGDSIDATEVVTKVQSAIKSAHDLADATLSIVKDGDKSVLSIQTNGQTRDEDVSKLTDNIVQIEQDQGPKSITIGKVNDNFGISQSGITALTDYPIHIDASKKTISVATNSGERVISIMPDDALETLVRANIVNKISKDGEMVLSESENGELTYSIPAERQVNLFNISTISVPINTTVSATSGKVLKVDQPKWLTIFGFLFS